ncbi:glycoside hydrolase family 19 protein [Chitinibacter fontanus]|uniref:Glycoside hydrolase family 19 protein n=1 Tax=Chitinibacter fontanus TaxID=1737446 RepID=A0A7D5V8A3_9NEIS|nr:glycoside hydrolase family 19 protein [Chitinibacter fontanus]QLI80777.1 glycoside hydrolase family 19 protein [Chitinibacter fontanus]
MQLSEIQLRQIWPNAGKRAAVFLPYINATLAEFAIDTPVRVAAFLAQVGHESGQLTWLEEIASGQAYDTGSLAKRLGNTPAADGDGQRYKGRGLIQITGTDNYRACGQALGVDLLADPEQLETPRLACRSAGWFWRSKGLNQFADAADFVGLTRRINGGTNGLTDRMAIWDRAKQVLGVK